MIRAGGWEIGGGIVKEFLRRLGRNRLLGLQNDGLAKAGSNEAKSVSWHSDPEGGFSTGTGSATRAAGVAEVGVVGLAGTLSGRDPGSGTNGRRQSTAPQFFVGQQKSRRYVSALSEPEENPRDGSRLFRFWVNTNSEIGATRLARARADLARSLRFPGGLSKCATCRCRARPGSHSNREGWDGYPRMKEH